jgi:hypothetical protein
VQADAVQARRVAHHGDDVGRRPLGLVLRERGEDPTHQPAGTAARIAATHVGHDEAAVERAHDIERELGVAHVLRAQAVEDRRRHRPIGGGVYEAAHARLDGGSGRR